MTSRRWLELLSRHIREESLFRLVLSRPVAALQTQKVALRPIELKGERLYQWAARVGAQERHENLTAAEVLQRVEQQFGRLWGDLHWFASDGDYAARWRGDGQVALKRKPPTQNPPVISHNQSRSYIIPDGQPCPFLIAVGIMLADGRVKPSAYHKFRQMNRYLEFIADVLPNLPATGTLRIVDFGCGKSYLTFALHHFLTMVNGRTVDIVGLDRKADVIAECAAIAERLGCAGLRFREGELATYDPAAGFSERPGVETAVDLAVSLHACDTATDDALAAALRWRCHAILAVPCCQHELCQHWPGTLPGISGYGLLRDRFAAMATDALRARFLDAQGYRTQVVEFIDLEHTPKNVLLRAIRRGDMTPPELAARRDEYERLKRDLGFTTWHLEQAFAGGP